MKNIFKYTFLQRLPVMLRYMSVLLGMTVIEALFLLLINNPFSGFYSIWLGVTSAALVIVPVFHFVGCASGYARKLLFTDESYLMLTLPVGSEAILFGRMLAGLCEFIIAGFISFIFLLFISGWTGSAAFSVFDSSGGTADIPHFWQLQSFTFSLVFIKNYKALLTLILLGINGFFFIGTLTLFAQMAVRSFTVKRRKGLIIVAAIVVFVGFIFFLGKIEAVSGQLFPHGFSVAIYGQSFNNGVISEAQGRMPIPLVSSVTALLFSVALFFASAYLLNKRVEV